MTNRSWTRLLRGHWVRSYRSPLFRLGLALTVVGFCISSGCGKKDGTPSVGSDGWQVDSEVRVSNLGSGRFNRVGCFQLQKQNQDLRLVDSNQACPSEGRTLLPDGSVRLALSVESVGDRGDSSGALYAVRKEGEPVGRLRRLSGTEVALVHLCQFSDPTESRDALYKQMCDLTMDAAGALDQLQLYSREALLVGAQEEQSLLRGLADRLQHENAELAERLRKKEDQWKMQETDIQRLSNFSQIEQSLDALTQELQLGEEASPGQIAAALAKQGLMYRQLSRELSELRIHLKLPKEASFEDVLKKLQSITKESDTIGQAVERGAERRDPLK